MLDVNTKVKIKWNNSTKKYYINLGYKYTFQKDEFDVLISELQPCSDVTVYPICDCCNKPYKQSYSFYYRRHVKKGEQLDICQECKKKTLIDTYYNDCLDFCKKHGYKLLSNKEDIKNNTTYMYYECPKHGMHKMKIHNMQSGRRCPDCNFEERSKQFRKNQNDVIANIEQYGGHLNNPDDYINQSTKNLSINCPICGKPFITSFRHFIQHKGQLCANCNIGKSKGEQLIKRYLDDRQIDYIEQHWFDDCRDINPLPFDFYLFSRNTIIEFDGRQHFGETHYFSYSYEETHHHDLIKNKYCKSHGIKLIRIPYWNIEKIDEILDNELT